MMRVCAARREVTVAVVERRLNPSLESNMKLVAAALALVALAASASAQAYVYEQPMAPAGGTLRNSALWIDPTGQNDLDSDAIAWEDFTLTQTATITRLRWWGEAAPGLGFQISFYNQDPNTIAVQPDAFGVGSGPISQADYTSFTQTSAGGNMYRFDVNLTTPMTFNANTRYFVSVVGRQPIPYAGWGWASSLSGPNGTFWWSRGLAMFFHLTDSRAMALATAAGWPVGTPSCFGDGTSGVCPCGNAGGAGAGCANSTGAGAILSASGNAIVGADTVVLTARQCPAATLGLFFGGSTLGSAAPFADGLRCVNGNVIRLGVAYTTGGIASSNTTLSVAQGLHAGDLRHYQFWYRNVLGPCSQGFNTTNALSIQW
jgi:hypothetical protein